MTMDINGIASEVGENHRAPDEQPKTSKMWLSMVKRQRRLPMATNRREDSTNQKGQEAKMVRQRRKNQKSGGNNVAAYRASSQDGGSNWGGVRLTKKRGPPHPVKKTVVRVGVGEEVS